MSSHVPMGQCYCPLFSFEFSIKCVIELISRIMHMIKKNKQRYSHKFQKILPNLPSLVKLSLRKYIVWTCRVRWIFTPCEVCIYRNNLSICPSPEIFWKLIAAPFFAVSPWPNIMIKEKLMSIFILKSGNLAKFAFVGKSMSQKLISKNFWPHLA